MNKNNPNCSLFINIKIKTMVEYSRTYYIEKGDMLCVKEDSCNKCHAIYPLCRNYMKLFTSNSGINGSFDNNNGNSPENSININNNGILDEDSEQGLFSPVNGSNNEDGKNTIIRIQSLSLQIESKLS